MQNALSLKLPAFPPFEGIDLLLPIDCVQGPLGNYSSRRDCAGLLLWTLTSILSDQYTEDTITGAWSMRYPDYLHFVYGDSLPRDVALRDTISYSAWIGLALERFRIWSPEPLSMYISSRLCALTRYLMCHQDPVTGGFGLDSKPTSRDPKGGIHPDLRHTVWAVITLSVLAEQGPPELTSVVANGLRYVEQECVTQRTLTDRAITLAVVHKLFSTELIKSQTYNTEEKRKAICRQLEDQIVLKFDRSFGTWDMDRDPRSRAAIDNSLIVLTCVRPQSCVTSACAVALHKAINWLCSQLVVLEGDQMALPFSTDCAPDIGASAVLWWLLERDWRADMSQNNTRRALAQFISNPKSRSQYAEFAWPWYLAAILNLACLPPPKGPLNGN